MTSYLPSFSLASLSLSSSSPSSSSATAAAAAGTAADQPRLSDAPPHALPPAEATALAELRDAALPVLAAARPNLPPRDLWAALHQPTHAHLLDVTLLRLLRHHALSVRGAARQLQRIADWRVSSRVAAMPPAARMAPGGGLPVAELAAVPCRKASDDDGGVGGVNEALFFSAADHYDKSLVERPAQTAAVEKMFDYLMYDEEGPRVSSATVVVDFTNFGRKNIDLMGTKMGISTYLNSFPAVFNRVLLVNYPTLIYGFWRAVRPLLDTRTANRILFLSDLSELSGHMERFTAESRPPWLGGTAAFEPVKLYNGLVLQADDLAQRFKVPLPSCEAQSPEPEA